MDFIKEMEWRGMIHDSTPGLSDVLKEGVTSGYVGFDPTATSLHIGNLVPIMLLVHYQRCGHKPIALIGGATGLIGDPSGKSSERNLLNIEEINYNISLIKPQLELFLDFDLGLQSAEIVNNMEWFKSMNMISFFRDVGKHLTLNYMMAKDSVQNRLETGISFTEFSYQLIQAYDFYFLNKSKQCKVQIGGSDQWGNITAGIELIKKISSDKGYALTTPLITKSDGSKFGKTEEGNIWLDAKRTSPYKFYQYWLNISDKDAEKCIKIFTILNQKEIENILTTHKKEPHLRFLQKELAKKITCRVHSEEAYNQSIRVSDILFSKNTSDRINEITEEEFLMVFEGVDQYKVSKSSIHEGVNPLILLTDLSGAFNSKGEVRRLIQSNAISINKVKLKLDSVITGDSLLNNKYLLVQKGKKHYSIICVE
ncbi:MAG: tyrosine--tRNA ligase [Flavobacteriales bacterium]|jgi:tyrosyl-tRNA synthetase|nr:tyrosine--tRNA ligase [Flavobacteriales bacterium]|tara:strand:+ start:57577 stop:58851 length:1275 start_codon:yes stop_codon:yes gene_type:complete